MSGLEIGKDELSLSLFNKWGVVVHVEIKGGLSGVVSLLSFCRSGDQIQVIRPVRNCWCPLSISPVNNYYLGGGGEGLNFCQYFQITFSLNGPDSVVIPNP